MALAAYVQRDVRTQGRAGFDLVTTTTLGSNIAVLRVNVCFHANLRRRYWPKKEGG